MKKFVYFLFIIISFSLYAKEWQIVLDPFQGKLIEDSIVTYLMIANLTGKLTLFKPF